MSRRKFDRYMLAIGAGKHVKFARLTDSERCAHFLGVLSIAAQAPIRGALLVGDTEAEAVEIAREAGVTEKVAAKALEKLKAIGVLVRDDELDCYVVHDWADVNPEPKNDPTNAERQARYRARRNARNGPSNSTSNAPVTPSITPPEVEGEVEVKSVGGARANIPTLGDPRVDETVAILRTCPRLTFDLELMAVANTLAAFPKADHVQAAHVAVANATDPSYRSTDAGKALRYAINELERSATRNGGSSSHRTDRATERERRQDEREAVALRLIAERQSKGEAA